MKKNIKARLFLNFEIFLQQIFSLEEKQAHYLLNVLRLDIHDEIKVFDGKNGEFLAEIVSVGKKSCQILVKEKLREMAHCPNVWLLFAPVKKDKTDFIVAGATELGVAKIIPTITQRTISERIKKERYEAQVIEAAEQCRRLDIPQISEPQTLGKILADWPENRILYFMDETGQGGDIASVFQQTKPQPAAVLVGPEGGFDEEELKLLRRQKFACAVSMGKRILRAETAVMAALSCWQAALGDWK